MNCLVTGATGFIGSHLCRALLEEGYRVRAFLRPTSSLALIRDLDLEHAVGDITQPETLAPAMQGVDVVFHAASKVDYWRDHNGMYPVTVGGTRHVLQAALNAGVQRVVYTSSVASLGLPEEIPGLAGAQHGRFPDVRAGDRENSDRDDPLEKLPGLLDETHVWNFEPRLWRYGHAKHRAEREVQWAVAGGLDAVIVNPTIVLGAGDVNRISGELVLYVAKGIVKLGIPGGMNAIHVEDVVRGHLAALSKGRRGERYILGGENLTYLALIRIAAEISGVSPPTYNFPTWLMRPLARPVDLLSRFVTLPFNGDLLRFSGRYLYYDTAKARHDLGFEKTHSVRGAIQDTYDWYESRGMV